MAIAAASPLLRPGRALLPLLVLVGLAMLVDLRAHPEGGFTRGGLPHGDGLYHYATVCSLVLDGDLRIADELGRLGNPHAQPVQGDGWAGNHHTIGTAIVWAPTFVVGHAVSRIGAAAGAWEDAGDGTSVVCQRITMLGSTIAAWLSLWLAARTWSRLVGARAVGLAVVLAAVATPLWWYATRQPSWSHAASALAVAGLLAATAAGGPSQGARRGAVVGVWLGLTALVRPQDVVFVIWPLAEGLAALREREGRGAAAQGLAAMLVVAALCFAPQAWVWQATYGAPLVVPQGPEFMRWDASAWDLVLWSSRGGLLAWSPAIGLSLVGLGLAAWRSGPLRWPARALLLSLALDVYVCGAVDDWWGGWAFGGRRLVGGTMAFVLGWAVLLERVLPSDVRASVPRRRPFGGGSTLVVAALAIGSVRLSSQMQADYLSGRLARGVPQPLAPAWSRAFGMPLDGVLETLGTPGSWPASWIFAARTGASPGRYDRTAGWALVRARGDAKGYERLWIDDPRWALAGLGPLHDRGEHRARTVEHHATLAVPLRTSLPLVARLRAFSEAPAVLEVDVAGERLELSLRPGWHDYALPREPPWPAGISLVVLRGAAPAAVELAWLDVFLPGHDPMAR